MAVLEALGRDPRLGPCVTADPGRRVPGAADGFELAVRAVIGQQVSVPGARTIAGRLVAAAGEALPEPTGGVTHLFPTPAALVALAEDDPASFSMPAGRRRALVALARPVDGGAVVIDPGSEAVELRASLVALPGIGPWTAEYVAMRGRATPRCVPADRSRDQTGGAALWGSPTTRPGCRLWPRGGAPGGATPWSTCGGTRSGRTHR